MPRAKTTAAATAPKKTRKAAAKAPSKAGTKRGASPPGKAPAKKATGRKKKAARRSSKATGPRTGKATAGTRNSGKGRTALELIRDGAQPENIERAKLREFEREMLELAEVIDAELRPLHEADLEAKAAKGWTGAPGFFPTLEDRHRVLMTASMGLKRSQVAVLIRNPATGRPIGEETLNKAFRNELDIGPQLANAAVSSALFATAIGGGPGSVRAAVWWEKTRMGMSDRVTVEVDAKAGVLVAPATQSVDDWVAENAEIRDTEAEVVQ
jgi:hypothetical protein